MTNTYTHTLQYVYKHLLCWVCMISKMLCDWLRHFHLQKDPLLLKCFVKIIQVISVFFCFHMSIVSFFYDCLYHRHLLDTSRLLLCFIFLIASLFKPCSKACHISCVVQAFCPLQLPLPIDIYTDTEIYSKMSMI